MTLPKLIAVDVDGTLYDSYGAVSDRVRASLQRARELGIQVAVASGRPASILPSTIELMGGADWNVGGNGGTVIDVASGEVVFESTVSLDVAATIVRGMRSVLPGVGFSMELTHANVAEPGFNRRIPPGDPADEVDDVLMGRDPAARVRKTIMFHDEFDDRQGELAALAAPFIDDSCECRFWSLPIVEITKRGTDKQQALEFLAAHLGIDDADVMAFGDAGNDLDMLRWAGTGVAMGNASAEIQAVANAVTATNDHDGIAVFLEPLLEISQADNG